LSAAATDATLVDSVVIAKHVVMYMYMYVYMYMHVYIYMQM